MDVTLVGIVRLVNELQPVKAAKPMDVTLVGIVRLVNKLQPLKASASIYFILDGIINSVIFAPEKKLFPMNVILLGILIDRRDVQ
jgi:hypothetical protein